MTPGALLLLSLVAAAEEPTLSDRYLARAVGFIQTGQLGRARDALEQAIRRDPASARSHYLLGRLDEQKRDWDSAARSYEEALRHEPTMAAAHDRLGFVRGEQGRGAEAIAEFARAATLRPDLFDARYHAAALRRLGESLQRHGDGRTAARAFREADRVSPR